MRKLSLEYPGMMDILNHQVIHMDQGVTNNPEYLATRAMRHYPSRTAQVIRSVYNKELPASKYGADIVFAPILSGQGERWQNFGENQNGYLLSVVLGRELFIKEGFRTEEARKLKERVEANDGHYLPQQETLTKKWKETIPVDAHSKDLLLLDEATYTYACAARENLETFFKKCEISFCPEIGPYFTGFDYFAAGLIEEAIEKAKQLVRKWEKLGIKRVVTLCGQSQYFFTTILSWFEIETEIQFVSILDLADSMEAEQAYLYGGSYFTRYLRKDNLLNQLLNNKEETPIPSCPEFLPEVDGDQRKNKVGIWTPPLCAEYHPMGMPKGLEDQIYEESLKQIKACHFKKMVVCDPFAYHSLLVHGYEANQLIYFTEIIK